LVTNLPPVIEGVLKPAEAGPEVVAHLRGAVLVLHVPDKDDPPLEDVVLDACVIFPGSLRDTLLRFAEADFYKLHLTDQILEEMRRNLVEKKHITEKQGQSLINQIKGYFGSDFVTQYTHLIPSMPVNEKDRHVLAAAVASGSKIIVTQNLRDFPQPLLQPFELEALSADEFLVRQFLQSTKAVIGVIEEQAHDLKRNPITVQDLLEKRLGKLAPNFVRLVQSELHR
jgi:predicted nucleic acid-binding protein